jgi:transposase InsO family protein
VAIAATASPYGLDLRDDSHAISCERACSRRYGSLTDNPVLRRPLESGQFVSLDFGKAARGAGIAQSMGSKGDCFDNAVAESFFATIKKELVHRRSWPSKAELRTEVFDYIEVFYNRQRRHSRLGGLSPARYEMITLNHDHEQGLAA